MIPQGKYVEMLNQKRLNHANFKGMDGGIKGEVIVGKPNDEFDLLTQFRVIKSSLPVIGHSPLIDLDVSLKEMFEMEIVTDQLWKDIHKFGSQQLARVSSS